MNANQRQSILNAIAEFRKLDSETPFKEKFKDTASIDSVYYGDYTLPELFTTSEKAIQLLGDFIKKDTWQPLQYGNIYSSGYHQYSLTDIVKQLENYLSTANYEQAAQITNRLVLYEMQYGIWNRNKRTGTDTNRTTLNELEKKASLTLTHITAKGTKIETLIEKLESAEEKVDSLINTQNEQIEKAQQDKEQAQQILNDLRLVQERASDKKNSIDSLNDKADDIIAELEKSQDKIKEQIKINDKTNSAAEDALTDFRKKAESNLLIIQSDYNNVSENAAEVRKMMHFIKDGALAHSFNIRTRAIRNAVIAWGICSFLSAIILGFWIYFVFTCINTPVASDASTANSAAAILANLVINIVKTSPIATLFVFSLAQYKKERHLQEEYAFREAVAVTLTAYLDQLDGEEDEHKRSLLLATVEKLYTKPVLIGDQNLSISLSSKDIAEALKNLGNTLKVINNSQNNKL